MCPWKARACPTSTVDRGGIALTETLIRRDSLPVRERKREVCPVEALGGSVAVIQMSLGTRLAAEDIANSHERGDPRVLHQTIPLVLADCVLDADGRPLMSAEQWSIFGGENRNVAIDLFNVAMRLSGFGADTESAEKN